MSAPILLRLIALLALLAPVRGADLVVLTSPRGTFEIVQAEETFDREWVVSAKDRTQRGPLAGPHDAEPHTYAFSPDERWIFAHVHIGSGMGAAKLFRQTAGVKFTPFRGEEGWLDDLIWRFYWRTAGIKPRTDDEVAPGDEGMIDFVAWSPDSARVLLALRAGEKKGKGLYRWHAYLNTRTGKLELTDYLRAINRDAARRWEDADLRQRWAPPASAEPIDPLPPEAELQQRWKTADERINALYTKVMATVKPEQKAAIREQQRSWLIKRDAGAAEYAAAGAKSAHSQRRWQFLADATETRIQELEVEIR